MVTPRFSLRQDEEFVVVDMRVPGHVRLGEDDVFMQDRLFLFHAHPYFLRFVLPLACHHHHHHHQQRQHKKNKSGDGNCGDGTQLTGWSCLGMLCRMGENTRCLTGSTTG